MASPMEKHHFDTMEYLSRSSYHVILIYPQQYRRNIHRGSVILYDVL